VREVEDVSLLVCKNKKIIIKIKRQVIEEIGAEIKTRNLS